MERPPPYLYDNLSHAKTGELLKILQTNDRVLWTEADLDLVCEVLRERGVKFSPQGEPVHETGSPQGISAELMSPELRGEPVALNFVLALIANALIIAFEDLARYRGQLGLMYCGMCLPVSAVIIGIGALVGVGLAKQAGDSPTTGAVLGIWISAILAAALSVSTLLSVGPGR
jgi:hypothetical protein